MRQGVAYMLAVPLLALILQSVRAQGCDPLLSWQCTIAPVIEEVCPSTSPTHAAPVSTLAHAGRWSERPPAVPDVSPRPSRSTLAREENSPQGQLNRLSRQSGASTSCSGRGQYEPDTKRCHCNSCYTGTACENGTRVCVLPLLSVGQPYLFQEYWRNLTATEAEGYAVKMMPDYRAAYQMPYVFPPQGFPLPPPWNLGYDVWKEIDGVGVPLDQTLRKLHQQYSNANTTERYIITGTGATQLFQAAIFAYSKLSAQETRRSKRAAPAGAGARVFGRAPRYDMYSLYYVVTQNPSVAVWTNRTDLNASDETVIELLTHPNNPDGHYRLKPFYSGAKLVHDLVYYWPHLCSGACNGSTPGDASLPRLATIDSELMVFSLTKMTGHAASRFGWALVKDFDVVTLMLDYITTVNLFPSVDTQYRALRLLQHFIAEDGRVGRSFFQTTRHVLVERWQRLLAIFANASCFKLRSLPNSAYAWIECSPAVPCTRAFWDVGLWGAPGAAFGQPDDYHFRINLTLYSSDFEILLEKLRRVIATTAC